MSQILYVTNIQIDFGAIALLRGECERTGMSKPLIVTAEELAAYRDGSPVLLAEGTLARSRDSSAVYVISQGLKRPIASAETFEAYGYDWKNILTVAKAVLDLHKNGAPLTLEAAQPATGVADNPAEGAAGTVVPVPAAASSDGIVPTPVPPSTTTAQPWW